MTVRLGLIGCGRIAEKHLRTIAMNSRFRLAAVSDIAPERMQHAVSLYGSLGRETEAAQVHKRARYQALIEDAEVDAVVITALSGLHASIAVEALQAGKPVMVEKPIALTLQDADRIIEMSERHKAPVLVCHQLRYRPLLSELKDALEEERLGRMLYGAVSLRIRRDEAYYAAAPWRGNWEHDGGMLVNQGIHLLDLLQWYLGEAQQVNGHLLRASTVNKETEDAALATIQFADGAAGIIDANTVSLPMNLEQSLHLFGESGTAAIGGEAFDRIVRWSVPGVSPERASALWQDRREHSLMYEDLMQAVEHGKQPLVNAREGKKALELVFAIYRSHLEQRPVMLPTGHFTPLEFRKAEVWNR